MSLFSASEDFLLNTLSVIPGVWGKLCYVSSLRRADGRYKHWGLARKYSENAAQEAILGVHQELALQVLRTPIRLLLEETSRAAAQGKTSLPEYVALLNRDAYALLPADFRGGSAKHFMTVLESLSYLARTYKDASRLVS